LFCLLRVAAVTASSRPPRTVRMLLRLTHTLHAADLTELSLCDAYSRHEIETQRRDPVASPGYYHLFSEGVRVNADSEYGPWPEWMKRVYYDCWNVTELLGNASLRQKKAVVFGLRIGPGTYGHAGAQNFARSYNASALPLLFELHVDFRSRAGGSIVRHRFVSTGIGHTHSSVRRSSGGVGDSVQPVTFSAHADPILNSDW
jgi:hypothetical protein